MFTHLLAPVDGSVHAQLAVETGAGLAARLDARLTLIHVVAESKLARMPKWLEEYVETEGVEPTGDLLLQSLGGQILSRAADTAKVRGIATPECVSERGNPATVICSYADQNDVDLIVMGRRGLGDLGGFLMGSVSHKVSHLSQCACMTVI